MERSSHILMVEARFYPDIADELIRGATQALELVGATFDRWSVPGVFELPMAIGLGIQRRFDGFIVLGCVIRGETSHYDHICAAVFDSLQRLAIDHHLALGSGILTVENHPQARARAAIDNKNKGAFAARACLAMLDLKRHSGV